uniref:Uncharacterized protein n=1 Tax=Meloidogyne floridensis TaxID=298350 RepID=A0A915NGV3_9BILA
MLKNRINKNLNMIEVNEETVNKIRNILKKLHKEVNEENQKDISEESMEANSDDEIKLQTLEEQNNNPLNFQPIQEEEEDDYWIKWNLETEEEVKDDKLKKD